MAKTKLTAKELKTYVAESGKGRCPFCSRARPEGCGWGIDGSGTIAFHNMECGGCGAEWMDEYRLCNMVVLKAPEVKNG